MLGVVAQMPTDLRRHESTFELETDHEASSKRSGIIKLSIDIPSSHRPQVAAESHPPPRWRTPEFILYGLVFCVVVPMLAWVPISLSSSSHPNYNTYRRRLQPGWLFGRQLDNSDAQYRSFRNNIPSLILLASAFIGLKHLYTIVLRRSRDTQQTSRSYLIPYLFTFSLLMLAGLHGTSMFKILLIVSGNYAIAKLAKGSKLNPLLTWVFNAAVLFANEQNEGYRFGALHPSLEYLDSVPGIYPRWHVSFNITMLRLVSFNMDYYWACNKVGPSDTYSYMNYIAYVLYPPLYIAGPIMAFNDFMWQDTKAWGGDTAAQLCMIAPDTWRFFRLWALNMVRCMAKTINVRVLESVARSYNLWIIRNEEVAFTSLLIFSFVALWHDLSFRLLAWGWLVTLFIIPELIARYILHPLRYYGSRPWYRHVCAIGAVFNILMMMAANLVGFVIGTDGVSYMLQQLLGTTEGVQFLLFACACLFIGAQVMFEYREEELRQGIVRRC
ncbi:MBOAT-domain-containing protein [Fomitopsis serialis]|uniref:MBOAT-domain-containing protein n=1 Tax=Fomitopsis serialis TaxID=139415 RepID=UPI002007675C|nr:MBOAT-domain-containing protein [Neoantrodia serialis]KAH9930065.1 MBOAT-domain-containing protein [Neoantrodia serialis]